MDRDGGSESSLVQVVRSVYGRDCTSRWCSAAIWPYRVVATTQAWSLADLNRKQQASWTCAQAECCPGGPARCLS
jgi:hypothetical protein